MKTLPGQRGGIRVFLSMCGAFIALWVFFAAFSGVAHGADGAPAAPSSGVAVPSPLHVHQEGIDASFADEVVTYTIWVTNTSGSTVSDILLQDTWTTNMPQANQNPNWWDRGILPEVDGYEASPSSLVTHFTHTLNLDLRRGEGTWTIPALDPGQSVKVEFRVTVPITLQPSLNDHLPLRDVGPSSVENTTWAEVSGYDDATAPLAAVSIVGPILRVEKFAEAEVAPPGACRVGRLVTYTIQVHNLTEDGSTPRPDAWGAENLIVREQVPDLFWEDADWLVDAFAHEPGVGVTYDSGTGELLWTFPSEYVLLPGRKTYVTFTVRVDPFAYYNPTHRVQNPRTEVWAQADGMPYGSAIGKDNLNLVVLSPFDKQVVTAPEPPREDQTYPERMITYTVTFYNPLHDAGIPDLRLEDGVFETFIISDILSGPPNPQIAPSLRAVRWDNVTVAPNGAISFTMLVSVPAHTLPSSCSGGLQYVNAVTGTPLLPTLPPRYVGDNDNKMAKITVLQELKLLRSVDPGQQIAGEIVTYTVEVRNVGDRIIKAFDLLTVTLPYIDEHLYFYYDSVVDPTPEPTQVFTNVIVWDDTDVPTLIPDESYFLHFRVVAMGYVNVNYSSDFELYHDHTSVCPQSGTSVRIKSPFEGNKTVFPDTVVQDELVEYTAYFRNISPRVTYTLTHFQDDLSPIKFTDPADGDDLYWYTPTNPVSLPPMGEWQHTFEISATGDGLNTPWCLKFENLNIRFSQEKGTVLYYVAPSTVAWNLTDEAPVTVIPHLSLFQEAFPNPVTIEDTMQLTLTLRDNRTVPPLGDVTGIKLKWELPTSLYGDFVLVDSVPTYTERVDDVFYWDPLTLTQGLEEHVLLTLRAPALEGKTDRRMDMSSQISVEELDDMSLCVSPSKEMLKVRRGVEIQKTPNVDQVPPYREVEYTLRAQNLTGADVPNVVITDVLPANWRFLEMVEGPEPDWFPAPGEPIVWTFPNGVDAQSTEQLRFKVRTYVDLGLHINEVLGQAPINLGYHANYTKNVEVFVVSGIGFFKDAAPRYVDAGNTTVYTVTLHNGGNYKLDGIFITDTLPSGFHFVEALQAPIPPFTDVVDGKELVLFPISTDLPSGDELRLVFRARTETNMPSGCYYNQASIQAQNSSTGELADIPPTGLSAKVCVRGAPTIPVDKSVVPTSATAGEEVTYTLSLYNETEDAYPLIVTDTLPPDVHFVAPIDPPDMPITRTGAQEQVVWTGLTISGLQTKTLTFRARVARAASSGAHCNDVQVQAGSFVLSPHTGLACVDVQELPRVDAQVGKDDGVQAIEPGQTLTYVLPYANAADSAYALQDVVITDTLEPITYVTWLGGSAGWSDLGDGLFRYSVGALAPGTSGTLTFVVQVDDPVPGSVAVVRNTAEIGYTLTEDAVEVNTDDNRAVDEDLLQALIKEVAPQSIDAGQSVVYTITLSNNLDDAWANIVITDTLPINFMFEDMLSGPTPNVIESGDQLQLVWTVPNSLEPDATLHLVFRAGANVTLPTADYYNEVEAAAENSSTGAPVDLPPTGPTAPVHVQGAPSVAVVKVAHPIAARAGEMVVYTVTVSNLSDLAYDLTLTDTLPMTFTFDAAIAPTDPPTVLPGPPEVLVWQGGSIAAQETLTYVYRVQAGTLAPSGSYCNSAQAQLGTFALVTYVDQACVDVTEIPRVDAQISKDDGVFLIDEGQTVTYTILYTNAAGSEASLENVIITETITPSIAVNVVSTDWTAAGESYVKNVGSLAPGASGTATFIVQVGTSVPPDVMAIKNIVEIGYTTAEVTAESNPDDNRDEDTDILSGPDLIVTDVRIEPGSPKAGESIQAFVTVKNQGNAAADERWDGSKDGWLFITSIYLKPEGSPAPTDVFDHGGEFCLAWPTPLEAGESQEFACDPQAAPATAGTYEVYAQADVTWDGDGYWGQDFGLVKEAIEDNNIYAEGSLEITATTDQYVYLPLVMRDH
jgi:uncharacterized repeat protein (TIGR01451 family)